LSLRARNEIPVPRHLLAKLKGLLVLDWRKRQSTQARVRDTIKDVLDTGLPRAYSPELYAQKCSIVFEHIYESYPNSGEGVYAAAGN
jgi:type I restriction enzyme R subunit